MSEKRYDFVSYNDESFGAQPGQAPWFCLAGYVAPAEVWASFEAKWAEVLREENLTEFKMSDCENGGRGPYRGWDRARRVALQERLIRLIKSGDLLGFWTAIDIGAYKVLEAALPQSDHPALRRLHDPYFFLFAHLMQVTIELGLSMPFLEQTGDQVRFVFDRSDYSPRAEQMYQDLKTMNLPSSKYMGRISFSDSVQHPAIQAADLLAYEARRYILNRTTPRWHWQLLTESGKSTTIHGTYWDANEITREFAKWGRDGLL